MPDIPCFTQDHAMLDVPKPRFRLKLGYAVGASSWQILSQTHESLSLLPRIGEHIRGPKVEEG